MKDEELYDKASLIVYDFQQGSMTEAIVDLINKSVISELYSLITPLPVDEFGNQTYVLTLKGRADILKRIKALESRDVKYNG